MAFGRFERTPSQKPLSEINVTPLVDVMMVLVIILLVTAPLVTQSINVTLPKTAETTPEVKDQPLQLAIDAQQKLTLNKVVIADLVELEVGVEEKFACPA